MRILVVSDIHANLVALDAALRDAEGRRRVDAVWNLGDCVGYGPQPCECVTRLRELRALWVAGNHERAATGALSEEDFNPQAAAAIRWTAEQLSPGEKWFLDALPEVIAPEAEDREVVSKHRGLQAAAAAGESTLVHGTLRWPVWEYLLDYEAARAQLRLQTTPVSFVGHTHVPMLVVEDEGSPEGCELYPLRDGHSVDLSRERKMVINPGSIGQPRDGDRRASYAVYDTEAQSVTLHRVEYEIAAVQRLMEVADLPRWLIERLEIGR